MKEPKRLLSQGATDFERQLLRAVVSERPSALLRSRMQRGLGLVGPLAWATNVKAMLGAASGKLVGAAVAGVVVASGAAAYHLVARSPGATPEAAAPARAQVASPAAASPPAALPPTALPPTALPSAALTPAALPPASAPTAEPLPESAAPVAPSEPEATDDASDGQLREEIALLDAVRAALQRGDREQARSGLAKYRERFSDGILQREAKVLRRRADAKRARAVGGEN